MGLYLEAFKLPKLGVGITVKASVCGLLPRPMLIHKRHRPGCKGIILDALIVLFIVQLIQVALDLPALCPGQLHGIRKNRVAALLLVVTPCIVRGGIADENVTLPETVRPGRAGKPQEGFILLAGACRLFRNDLFINVKIALIKSRVLFQNSFKGSQHVHIFKFIPFPHRVSSFPSPATYFLPVSSAPPVPCRL